MVEAVVQFDYTAQEPDELTLQKGDVITDIQVQSGGWWKGSLKGKRGMFPDNFVKVIGEEDSGIASTATVTPRISGRRRCKVLFSYHPVNDDELALQVNDIVDILDEVEEGWWKGRLKNQTGVFPSNFVVELTDENQQEPLGPAATASLKKSKSNHEEPSKPPDSLNNHNEDGVQSSSLSSLSTDSDVPVLPPKPVKEVCKALYPYKALNDDELTLREGDIITVISKDGQDKGWWKGELNGVVGVFPDNFVQLLPADEVSKPLRPPSKGQTVTTNKSPISKPGLTSSSGSPPSSISASAANKNALETPPKPDEKTSPPGIGKKPTLPPPPLKKPQRSPTISSKQPISSPTFNDSSFIKPESPTPVSSARSPSISPASNKPAKRLETSDNTDGSILTILSSNSSSYTVNHHNKNSVHNNDSIEKLEIDLDCVGRTAMLTHPTTSRPKAPKNRRLPSNCPPKEDVHSSNSVGMMNGNVDSHGEHKIQGGATKTWLDELKMSQTKKQFSHGRTRVMIGSGSTSGGGESPSPEPPNVKPNIIPGVVLRNNASYTQRPQSMFSSEKTSPNTRPFSVIGTPSDIVTLTVKQWNELNDKVSKLEATVEAQHDMYMRMIKELTCRLNDESERVVQMKHEIEKLTDLVTQV